MVLILLPPSEGKTPPVSGSPVDPSALHFPELNGARKLVIKALAHVSAQSDALKKLGVGATLASDVARNTRLCKEAAAPAHTVYSGVLFDALGYKTLTPTQKRKADDAVVVISGLWGAVTLADRIPAYRLAMSVSLPEVGKLANFWKPKLQSPLTAHAHDHLLVDCRSSTYSAAWAFLPAQTVSVNVFTERGGTRKVVSHFAKLTRGELARHLLTRRGKAPGTPQELLHAAAEQWKVELVAGTERKAHSLNIILDS